MSQERHNHGWKNTLKNVLRMNQRVSVQEPEDNNQDTHSHFESEKPLSDELRQRWISTVIEAAKSLESIEADYRVVGGFAIDLLADHFGTFPLNHFPSDIDIAIERKGLAVFFDGPYYQPTTGNYVELASPDAALYESELRTMNTLHTVSINIHMTPLQPEIPVRSDAFIVVIEGCPLRVLSPTELKSIVMETIAEATRKGIAPTPKDMFRLQKIESVLAL